MLIRMLLKIDEPHTLAALVALDFAIGAVPFVGENALSESDCGEFAPSGMVLAGYSEIKQLKSDRVHIHKC